MEANTGTCPKCGAVYLPQWARCEKCGLTAYEMLDYRPEPETDVAKPQRQQAAPSPPPKVFAGSGWWFLGTVLLLAWIGSAFTLPNAGPYAGGYLLVSALVCFGVSAIGEAMQKVVESMNGDGH